MRGIQLPESHTLGGLHTLAGPQNLHLSRAPRSGNLGGWALLPTGVYGRSWIQPHSGQMFLRVTGFRAAGEGHRAPSCVSSPSTGTRGPHPLPNLPQQMTMVWGGLPETISGWAELLGWGGGAVMRRQDPTCSALWAQGPRVEAPACSSPGSPSRLGLASLQLQPHPPGPGPQPARQALVTPDAAPARAPAASPAQHPHLGGAATGGEAGEGPERRRWVVGPQRPDRRSQNGRRTRGRKGTGSERTGGRAAWWLLLLGGRRPPVEKARPVHTCRDGAGLLTAGPRQAQLQHVEVGGDTPGVWGSPGSGTHAPPSPLKTDPGMPQAPENRPTRAGSVFTQAEAWPGLARPPTYSMSLVRWPLLP